jgi:hypothetical protein
MQGSALDSHITRLLVTTKQLLQGLESWCAGGLDENGVSLRSQLLFAEADAQQVSDIYVRLGNGFEVCVAAFQRAGLKTLSVAIYLPIA